jgi:Surface antigen.
LEQYDIYHVDDDAAWLIRRSKGEHMSSVATFGVRRDTTDDNRKPTKGTIADLRMEYGGTFLGGTDDFMKPIAELQAFL